MTTKPSAAHPEQAALFDADLAAWRDHPERAFDGWLARHGFRHGTSVVYRAMWGKLLRWSAERGLPPLSWSAEQIGEFLDAQQLHKSHRYRYTRLIERVFHHLARLREGMHNPASQAVRAHLADGENDPTAFLLPGERDLLVARILGPAGMPAGDTHTAASPTQWKRARDAALLAVLLGGGLKVGEARALRVDAIEAGAPGRMALRMVRADNGRAYTVPLFSLAHAPLRAWLALREASGTLGGLVFRHAVGAADACRLGLPARGDPAGRGRCAGRPQRTRVAADAAQYLRRHAFRGWHGAGRGGAMPGHARPGVRLAVARRL